MRSIYRHCILSKDPEQETNVPVPAQRRKQGIAAMEGWKYRDRKVGKKGKVLDFRIYLKESWTCYSPMLTMASLFRHALREEVWAWWSVRGFDHRGTPLKNGWAIESCHATIPCKCAIDCSVQDNYEAMFARRYPEHIGQASIRSLDTDHLPSNGPSWVDCASTLQDQRG